MTNTIASTAYVVADDDLLLTEKQAAPICGKAPGTLRNERARRVGIRFVKLSTGAVRYRRADLLAYVAEHVVETNA